MITQMIFNTDYATLCYYPESRIMHHEFHKYIHGHELRSVLLQGLAVFQEYGIQKWLSDDRKNSALPQADLDWAIENWITPMINSGWKYWAVVLPDKPVGKAPMMRLIEIYSQHGVRVEIFEDPAEAYQWLESI